MYEKQVETAIRSAVELVGPFRKVVKERKDAALPQWKKQAESWSKHAFLSGLLFVGLAFLFKCCNCSIGAQLAVLLGLVLMILAFILWLCSLIPATTFNRFIAGDGVAQWSALWVTVAKARELMLSDSAWLQAAAALEHERQKAQQWQAFAGMAVAIALAIFLVDGDDSCGIRHPFAIIRAFFSEFPKDEEVCKMQVFAGAALVGGMIGLILTQVKIALLADAYLLAKQAGDPSGQDA